MTKRRKGASFPRTHVARIQRVDYLSLWINLQTSWSNVQIIPSILKSILNATFPDAGIWVARNFTYKVRISILIILLNIVKK